MVFKVKMGSTWQLVFKQHPSLTRRMSQSAEPTGSLQFLRESYLISTLSTRLAPHLPVDPSRAAGCTSVGFVVVVVVAAVVQRRERKTRKWQRRTLVVPVPTLEIRFYNEENGSSPRLKDSFEGHGTQ